MSPGIAAHDSGVTVRFLWYRRDLPSSCPEVFGKIACRNPTECRFNVYIGVVGGPDAVAASVSSEARDFASWVEPHWAAMTALAFRLVPASDVEDVVQDALASAWRQRSRFDPSRGSARTWLLTLTADQVRRLYRRSRRVPVPMPDVPGGGSDELPDPDLDRALRGLSSRQRLAIELFYYLGLPVSEVAMVMGCAEGTVKSTLADARARLRSVLGGAEA